MPIPGIVQPNYLFIDPDLRLRKYDDHCPFAYDWYQEKETLLLVDGHTTPYDQDKLYRMYHYLEKMGEVYFIEIKQGNHFIPIGDVTFCKEDLPIVIGPKHFREQHIGQRVIQALIQRAKTLNFPYLKVQEIYDYNHASIAMFTHLGFQPIEKTSKGHRYQLILEKETIMKIAIIYSSKTGNTELLANTINDTVNKQDVVYFGKPSKTLPEAELYFIGSWTDKGNASEDILNCLKQLKNKKIAFFATAGFGQDEHYYQTLFERVKQNIDTSNEVFDPFYCQGKMPMAVRERYVSLMTTHPEDKKLQVSIENFDQALTHPDKNDLDHLKSWVQKLI